MSGGMLKQILQEHVADKNRDMTMIVTDTTETDYAYDFKDTPLYLLCRYILCSNGEEAKHLRRLCLMIQKATNTILAFVVGWYWTTV